MPTFARTAPHPETASPRRVARSEWAVIGVLVLLLAGVYMAAGSGLLDSTRGEVAIITIRLVAPLVILRYWLTGGILAMLLDAADVIIIELLHMGGFGDHYAETDKLLDLWYYCLELLVGLRWGNRWMVYPLVALFAYRLVGAMLFEITHARILLFVFPNLFENWWLYCVVVLRWFPRLVPHDLRSTAVPLALLLIPKMAQEYLLHYAEAKPWNWTKEHILEPLGLEP